LLIGVDVPGYTSIMVAILFFSGVQLIGIGVLGEYIGRIHMETKKRPLYVIDAALGLDDAPAPSPDP
ncbi:MAG: glycosyltransferase, partial [Pseudomonadota bacterium]|nr:glycosyltransferase [Pseudomonadota bacterium]